MEVSLGVQNYINEKYSWRVVRKMENDLPVSKNRRMEINSKIALAGKLMCGAFEKIVDTHTGIDVVQNVVYSSGSNLTRLNFNRFYTFVIEEDDTVIAAALIRFNGTEIAEMPFIATNEAHGGKGICRLLMAEIESFLRGLEIKNLIVPSSPGFVEMWKDKYGFEVVNIGQLKKIISSCNMLMFPQATRLYKNLYRRPLVDVDLNV
ncbi:Acyl-CoA N-acyltransferase with RING/FYVE/PHD-type zinc finger protein [Trifolium repens]|nr:Acyl-CoA N-acyltransferase with RING/FYVE/PHD-type zinc finger protein [Trifolium repens]